jgi:transcriptional regulator with XRE-family HTH domain
MESSVARNRRPRGSAFGGALRGWRKLRGHSQLSLATEISASTRHLCFLENGRAQPSREMVLLLARALELPLRERNDLLEAAGFAREFRESGLEALHLAPVAQAIELLLRNHEPWPAIVVDRGWNLVRANDGARRLFAWLSAGTERPEQSNVLRALFDPRALRPFVADFVDLAPTLLDRVRREAVCGVLDGETRALLEDLQSFPGVPARSDAAGLELPGPLVPVRFCREGFELSFFSTLTTLGTPRDVTLQELRLEHFFPTDEATVSGWNRLAEVWAAPQECGDPAAQSQTPNTTRASR